MSLCNQVHLEGFCGNTPQLRYTKTHQPMASLSVYTRDHVNSSYWVSECHRCLFFGKLAELICNKAEEGRYITLNGMLRTQRKGEGKAARYYTNVIVETFQLTPLQNISALRDTLKEIIDTNHIQSVDDISIVNQTPTFIESIYEND